MASGVSERSNLTVHGEAAITKQSIARAIILSAALAMLAACVDNSPRNGAGQRVDPTTGTVAPGQSTSD
jgi:hypothetical protein